MKTFKCETCGDVEFVVVDGYGFGERLLEGVGFEIRWNEAGTGYTAKVEASSAEYFSQFNEAKWLKEAAEFTEHEEFAACGKCGNEIEMPELHKRPEAKPLVVGLSSFKDVLGQLGRAEPKTPAQMETDRSFLMAASAQDLVREVEKPKAKKKGKRKGRS